MKLIKTLSSVVASLFAIIAFPLAVAAQPTINIPVDTVIFSDQVGSTHELASEKVDPVYQEMICTVSATAKNQVSVHPNNDLVISSGTDSVTLSDVEREAFVSTTADEPLILGDELVVTLVMGDDKVFSGGIDVSLECREQPKDIEVCRDGKVITIKEGKRLETDTDAPCPQVISTVTTLPSTGANPFIIVLTTGLVGTFAHAFVTRKQ